jgi:hypothetical protein
VGGGVGGGVDGVGAGVGWQALKTEKRGRTHIIR